MGTPVQTRDPATHHALTAHEVLLLLGSDPHRGLSEEEFARRLERHGPNALPRTRTAGPVERLLRQLHSPLVYVLVASGFVTLLLGQAVDSAVIFGVVVANALIGFLQESRAESALDALRSMVHTQARVLRAGEQRLVDSEELVPGDLVVLAEGDKVPADLRVVREQELEADESALTGESLPVRKAEVALSADTPVSDRHNMAYSGTLVTRGTGLGIVVATGDHTELGEIHRLVGSSRLAPTPLGRKLAVFSTRLTGVILALAVATFAIGMVRGEAAATMFTAAVALAVGAIPEGLPAAVTITLAIGLTRMARRRAVVRRLPAVETMGGATVVCSDKTGTLTENRMTVRALWAAGREVAVPAGPQGPPSLDDADEALRTCLLVGANCNDARLTDGGGLGDPTEVAMLAVAHRHGVAPRSLERTGTLPFTSERRFMATTQVDEASGREILMVKGAVERVLDLCGSQLDGEGPDGGAPPPGGAVRALDAGAVLDTASRLAARGMRVLATAVSRDPGTDPLSVLEAGGSPGLTFAGLQAMLDPPRATAPAAVRTCRDAGIAVKMVTGDHRETAESVARDVGILSGEAGDRVLTGPDLDLLDEDGLREAADRTVVFARVSPAQKLRLVEALQAAGHVVAVTGDGVNDAPALRRADIGVAMGRKGTDVAKDAADIVLTDDDFSTIEAAIEEGRGVFDNLTKFLLWTLPTNVAEGLVILVAVVLGLTLPILPTQILWINMTTAVALGLMLAWEPKEPDVMQRPPRDPRRALFTGPMVFRSLLVAGMLVAGSWWVFSYELAAGASLETSRTAAVNLFVTVEAFYLFSCRSPHLPVWRVAPFGNRWLIVGVAVQALGQAAFTYLPAMNTIFHTAPIDAGTWGRIVLVAALVSVVVAVDKRRARPRQQA